MIDEELDRLGRALWADPKPERRAELYAAQQALVWVLQPDVTMPPYDLITASAVTRKDCSHPPRQATSKETSAQS